MRVNANKVWYPHHFGKEVKMFSWDKKTGSDGQNHELLLVLMEMCQNP